MEATPSLERVSSSEFRLTEPFAQLGKPLVARPVAGRLPLISKATKLAPRATMPENRSRTDRAIIRSLP